MEVHDTQQKKRKEPTIKVLVTGATGFVGSALAQHLHARGFYVRALTRNKNHSHVKKNPHYEWVEGDITKPNTLRTLCDEITFVFHAAGYAHAYEENDPNYGERHDCVNHQGTVNLLLAAKNHVKKFIYFSSVKACAESDQWMDERWDVMPCDSYGLAKRAAENAVLRLCANTMMQPVILRPTLIYGIGCKGNLLTMLKGVKKGYFPPPPDIAQHKSMIALEDVCNIAIKSALSENLNQSIFILTDGQSYSAHYLYQLMRSAVGKKAIKHTWPLLLWRLIGKMGDVLQTVFKKRSPINSQAVEKLFSSAAYRSIYLESELQFVPRLTLKEVLPIILKQQEALE